MSRFIVESVSNPKYIREDKTMIQADVKFTCFNEPVVFNACSDDVEAHGVQIYNDIVAGLYGEIGAYVAPPAPPAPTKEELLAQLQALSAQIQALE